MSTLLRANAEGRGVLTVACGARSFTEMAVDLALSLREHSGPRITLLADAAAEALVTRHYPGIFEHVVRLPDGYDFGYACKLALAEVTPYEHNLFIDADTLALSSIEPIWRACQHASLCMIGTHLSRDTGKQRFGFALRDLIDEFGLTTYFDNHSGAFYFQRASALPFMRECLEVYRQLYTPERRKQGLVGDELAIGIVGGRHRLQRMREPFPVLWTEELRALRPGQAPKPLCHFHAPPSDAALEWLMDEVVRRRKAAGLRPVSTVYWRRKAARGRQLRKLGAGLRALQDRLRRASPPLRTRDLPMIAATARPRPRSGYEIVEIDGEVVILHPATEATFYCNASAALIFRLCDGERDVDAILALLTQAYPEAAAQLPGEVRATLDQLVQHGALELA